MPRAGSTFLIPFATRALNELEASSLPFLLRLIILEKSGHPRFHRRIRVREPVQRIERVTACLTEDRGAGFDKIRSIGSRLTDVRMLVQPFRPIVSRRTGSPSARGAAPKSRLRAAGALAEEPTVPRSWIRSRRQRCRPAGKTMALSSRSRRAVSVRLRWRDPGSWRSRSIVHAPEPVMRGVPTRRTYSLPRQTRALWTIAADVALGDRKGPCCWAAEGARRARASRLRAMQCG